MTTPETNCCTDYLRASELSRRRFLGGVAAAGATSVSTSLFGQAVRQASFGASTGGNVMVVLSFRGGIDGLGLVVPHGDPGYAAARPSIALPKASLLAKDDMFGLHPDLASLEWLWQEGSMAAVQAVGMPAPNRSHFAAMEEIEDADPGSSTRQGWVNRMVGLGGSNSPLDAVHLGESTPPTMLEGSHQTVSSTALKQLSLTGATRGWGARRNKHLKKSFAKEQNALGNAARAALATVSTSAELANGGFGGSVKYPSAWPAKDLSTALSDTARLIRADVGTEVVSVDFGSWDMHDGYGTTEWGSMQTMVGAFASAVDAFMRDLGPLRSKVTVVTISEFGRRIAENGNRGLDHGWGNMMLVLGGGVKGGSYYGNWPGIGKGQDADGDLAVTTDYRQVLGEVVHRRFPDKDVSAVFPGLPYQPLGVLAAS